MVCEIGSPHLPVRCGHANAHAQLTHTQRCARSMPSALNRVLIPRGSSHT